MSRGLWKVVSRGLELGRWGRRQWSIVPSPIRSLRSCSCSRYRRRNFPPSGSCRGQRQPTRSYALDLVQLWLGRTLTRRQRRSSSDRSRLFLHSPGRRRRCRSRWFEEDIPLIPYSRRMRRTSRSFFSVQRPTTPSFLPLPRDNSATGRQRQRGRGERMRRGQFARHGHGHGHGQRHCRRWRGQGEERRDGFTADRVVSRVTTATTPYWRA